MRGLPIAALAWVAVSTFYVFMRGLGLFSVPVGGLELWSLAGAWQAGAGLVDDRYVPTLAQAVAAGLLRLDEGELLPRLVAFAAALTVPVSLFALRRRFGEPAALVTLAILAFDPLQIALGATATAAAFDLPLAFGTLALWSALGPRPWLLAVLAFAWTTAGPAGLPLALAVGLTAIRWRGGFPLRQGLHGVAGAAAGIAAASFGFGAGWQGVTVPPFDLFADGFASTWSSESTGTLFLLYAWVPTAFAAGYLFAATVVRQALPAVGSFEAVLFAWFAIAAGWVLLAGGVHDPLPAAALTASAAPLAGRGVVWLVDALSTADWARAGWPLAAAMFALVTLTGPILDWARLDRVGAVSEVVAVVALAGVTTAALGLLLLWPSTRLVPLAPIAALAAIPWLAGGFAVATGSPHEPLPAPITTLQASEIRDIVQGPARDPAGIVAIHPTLAEALTWPLRGSHGLVVTSRVPPNASIVIWPTDDPPPAGFRSIDGRWVVLRERHGPDIAPLDYLRWLWNRNILPVRDVTAAVYTREQP
jgi:hypothetical protein